MLFLQINEILSIEALYENIRMETLIIQDNNYIYKMYTTMYAKQKLYLNGFLKN